MTDASDAEVIEAEKARCRALIAADHDAMAALFADGFTYTHSSGRVDTIESYLGSLGARMRYSDATHSDLSVRRFGDVAILAGDLDLMQKPIDGDERPVNFRFIGVWVKHPGGWRIAAHQNTKRAG